MAACNILPSGSEHPHLSTLQWSRYLLNLQVFTDRLVHRGSGAPANAIGSDVLTEDRFYQAIRQDEWKLAGS